MPPTTPLCLCGGQVVQVTNAKELIASVPFLKDASTGFLHTIVSQLTSVCEMALHGAPVPLSCFTFLIRCEMTDDSVEE